MHLFIFWCLLILCLWSSTAWAQDESSCAGFLELDEPDVITCTRPTRNFTETITLQLKVNNEFANISTCNISGECTDNMAPVYTSTLRVIKEDGEEMYTMEVSITAVRKNENTFRCVYGDHLTKATCFEEFVKPAQPSCDDPALVNSNTQLGISCTSDRVYPGVFMSIVAVQDSQPYLPGDYEAVFEKKTSASVTYPGYFTVNYTALVQLSSLEPGTYLFGIKMRPSISDEALAAESVTELTSVGPLELTAPEVAISSSCPDESYITSGTCKCELSTPGNPPGLARWYTQSGQVVGTENSEDRSSTLTVSYESEDPPVSYVCRAETLLNVSSPSTVSFAPKFPFGPISVIVETSVADGIFDLCPSEEHINIVVTCKVPTEDVKPGVTFTILVNNDVVVDEQDGKKIDSYYFHHYSFRPSKGGSYIAECSAQNSISLQQSPSKALTFEVREPPPSSPVFHIPPNQPGAGVANVKLGKIIDITCKVDGGYRKVSEVTITCGSREQKVQSNIATLTLEVTQSMDGQKCYCTATHDTGCYDKESEVLLRFGEATEEDQGPDLDQLLIIVLPATAAVVVVVLVVVIIILLMRKSKRTPPPAPPPPKNDHSYSHPVTSTLGHGDYNISPKAPAQSDYAKVIINEDGSSNWDRSYNNPAVTDPNEYDRISDVFSPAFES